MSSQDGDSDEVQLFWDVTEEISLHSVAIGTMMDMFKSYSNDEELCSSSNSLRCAHIHDLAFLGQIMRDVGRTRMQSMFSPLVWSLDAREW